MDVFTTFPRKKRISPLALFVWALAFWTIAAPVMAEGITPLTVREVVPGVFVHIGSIELMTPENEGGIANLGFVIGSDGVAVIDTGGSVREGRSLLAAIRHQTSKPIRYVINTHMHPDHIFGNAAFNVDGAVFIGHRNLPGALGTHGDFYIDKFKSILGKSLMADVRIVVPTEVVADSRVIDLGDRKITLKAWPVAHTNNDLTAFDQTSGTLFAGDLLFVSHLPVLDGNLIGWLNALTALANLPVRQVIPGHGPVVSQWPAALVDERHYLQCLNQQIRAMIARGVPIATAAKIVCTNERSRWDLFDVYHSRNATAAFAELEWE
jgi:quinoprotein relay system zinc metallohydrolase 2